VQYNSTLLFSNQARLGPICPLHAYNTLIITHITHYTYMYINALYINTYYNTLITNM